MAKEKYKRWLEPDGLVLLEGWSRDGLSKEQIAHNCGINVKTLREWEAAYPPICTALKKGRDVADFEVENAMFKSALGYWVEEMEEKIDQKGQVHETWKKRWIPPSNTAQIFWLKNRRPDKWRDKPVDATDDKVLEAAKLLLGGVNSAIE